MIPDSALLSILDGSAILFAGAGLSVGALNAEGQPLPTSTGLAKLLCDASHLPPETPLSIAADEFLDLYGPDKLLAFLQRQYGAVTLAAHQVSLVKYPWRRIYTTNYDNSLELASTHSAHRLYPVSLTTEYNRAPKTSTLCVHFNGFIDHLTKDSLTSDLKLGNLAYAASSITDSPWAAAFRHDVRTARATFFVGYSLYDIDVRRLLVAEPDIKDRCFFILGTDCDKLTIKRASHYGQTEPIDASQLAEQLALRSMSFIPSDPTSSPFLSINEFQPVKDVSQITDKAVLDLLLYGAIDDKLVTASYASESHYFLKRTHVSRVLRGIGSGDRLTIVASELGNGKSLFLSGLHHAAFNAGYRVFAAKDKSAEAIQELARVATISGRVLVTVDDYAEWSAEIGRLLSESSDQTAVVCTCRNSLNDVLVGDLYKVTGFANIPEVYIDSLDSDELAWLIELFDKYGLWGEHAARSKQAKIRFLQKACGGEMHGILLMLFRSPGIHDKLAKVYHKVRANPENHKVVLAILALTVLSHTPDSDMVMNLFGADAVQETTGRKRAGGSFELIEVNRGAISVRSSIAAKYLLNWISDGGMTVQGLIGVFERASNLGRISEKYNSLAKDLMRFGNVQLVLPAEGRTGAVITYYEALKNRAQCRYNPLFWLQYAIAALVLKDIVRAKKYFETAYSYAHEREWDTYQIDNHYARFLLVEAVESGSVSGVMESFRKARMIVERQMRNERLGYPYRVARLYRDVWMRFGSKLSEGDRRELGSAAGVVLDRIARLPEATARSREVTECAACMQFVLRESGCTP